MKYKLTKKTLEEEFSDSFAVKKELAQCIIDSDFEGFIQILAVFLETQNKSHLAKTSKLDRDTIYRAIRGENLSLESTFKILKAI